MTVRPAKTQISLGSHPVWSESSLCTQWVAKDPSFLHADSEDSDQTGRMPRLIWVFAGRTCHFVGFVMRGLKLNATTGTLVFLQTIWFSLIYKKQQNYFGTMYIAFYIVNLCIFFFQFIFSIIFLKSKFSHLYQHLRSLISAFVVRCLDSTIPLVSISEIPSLYLASVAAQAGLWLTWSQTQKTGFLVTWLICSV